MEINAKVHNFYEIYVAIIFQIDDFQLSIFPTFSLSGGFTNYTHGSSDWNGQDPAVFLHFSK